MGAVAERFAERLGATNIVEIIRRVLSPGAADTPPPSSQSEQLAEKPSAFASLSSQSMASESKGGHEECAPDTCFVVLNGEELRFVIYAILGPRVVEGVSFPA